LRYCPKISTNEVALSRAPARKGAPGKYIPVPSWVKAAKMLVIKTGPTMLVALIMLLIAP
jgi:hypothetical protein